MRQGSSSEQLQTYKSAADEGIVSTLTLQCSTLTKKLDELAKLLHPNLMRGRTSRTGSLLELLAELGKPRGRQLDFMIVADGCPI